MCNYQRFDLTTEIHLKPCQINDGYNGKHFIVKRAIEAAFTTNSGLENNSLIPEILGFMMPEEEIGLYEDDPTGIANLYPAVIENFGIIFLGYLAGKFGIISPSETKGLNTFIGTFSLPALIFLSMAQLDLSLVNWWFLLAIFMAKSLVFFSVIIISLLVSRPSKLDKAGLFAIFATQSNDFALGFPIVQALYHKTHPEYASYLYLVAPVNLLFLNPISFVMMEFTRQKSLEMNESSGSFAAGSTAGLRPINGFQTPGAKQKFSVVFKNVLKGVLLNPIIIMTCLGIGGNLIFQHCLPQILEGILKIFGSSFSACALFSLGLTMVGSAASLKGSGFVVPGILIAMKLLVLPVLTREFVSLLEPGANVNETVSLSNYGFLYGTFPTAPGVFVYANQFDVGVQMIAGAMVACTFISAPLMFVSAKMITLRKLDPKDYVADLDNFLFNMSIIGLVASVWVIVVFVLSRKWKKVPHCITLCLVSSQAIGCIGAILWSWIGVDKSNSSWKLYLQFGVFAFGVLSSRIWTAILAISLVFLRCRSLCFVLRLRPFMGLVGWGIPTILITVLMLAVQRETLDAKQDPNFQYGETQAIVALMVLVLCFIVTIGCLVIQQRYERQYGQYDFLNVRNSDDESLVETQIENIVDVDPNENRAVPIHRDGVHRAQCLSVNCSGCPQIGSCSERRKSRPLAGSLKEIEDLANSESSGDSDSDVFNYNDDVCASSKHPCDGMQKRHCSVLLEKYRSVTQLTEPEEIGIVRDRDDEFQMLRHIVLLLLLCCSMFVGIALCIWTLIVEEKSGIYVELVFLDGALNFGQGFFTFMLFGLNTKMIVMPLHKWWRRIAYGEGSVYLPKFDDLSIETKQICEQFLTYHIDKCKFDIVRDRCWRMESYTQVFCGHELVDWLLIVGLSKDRSEAIRYGRNLLNGRVIRHVKNLHHFHDQSFFYTFSHLD